MFSLEQVGFFVPKTAILVEENPEYFLLDPSKAKVFSRIYGLKRVPVSPDLSMETLVLQSVENLLVKHKIDREKIRFLIHSHTVRVITRFGDSIVEKIRRKLGLNRALAFGVTINNCASTLTAYEMAALFLTECEDDEYAIVVTGEKVFTSSAQVIPNTSITGDASAAVLIKRSVLGAKNQFLSSYFLTDGRFSKNIRLSPEESAQFEASYTSSLAHTIETAVSKAGLSMENIKLILPHNVNTISWLNTAKALKISGSKIYLKNISQYAHCFGADIMINYVSAVEEGLILPGDYFVMATVGLGATFAAAVFQH